MKTKTLLRTEIVGTSHGLAEFLVPDPTGAPVPSYIHVVLKQCANRAKTSHN